MNHRFSQIFFWLNNHKIIVLIELLLFSMYPYVLYCYFNIRNIDALLIVLSFFCSLLIFLNGGAHIKNNIFTKYVGFMCLFNLAYCILHGDSSYITRIIFSLTAFFFINSLCRNREFFSFIKVNTSIITFQAVLAMIAFLLFLFGIISRGPSFDNVDTRPCFSFGISFANTVLPPIARMSGYFDEPGALAFWGIYALLFNELFIKNKIIEYGLIIGLISTLSMAYFIQLALYLMFFKIKSFKSFMPFAVVLLLIASFAIKSQEDNSFYKLTFERFEDAGNGNTGRTELSELAYNQFIKSPIFGNGAKKIESIAYMGDNPYELPAKDGLIGTLFVYLPLLIVFVNCKNRKVRYSVIILLAGYLQRPFHINLMHYMMLYSFFVSCETIYASNHFKFKLNRIKCSNE